MNENTEIKDKNYSDETLGFGWDILSEAQKNNQLLDNDNRSENNKDTYKNHKRNQEEWLKEIVSYIKNSSNNNNNKLFYIKQLLEDQFSKNNKQKTHKRIQDKLLMCAFNNYNKEILDTIFNYIDFYEVYNDQYKISNKIRKIIETGQSQSICYLVDKFYYDLDLYNKKTEKHRNKLNEALKNQKAENNIEYLSDNYIEGSSEVMLIKSLIDDLFYMSVRNTDSKTAIENHTLKLLRQHLIKKDEQHFYELVIKDKNFIDDMFNASSKIKDFSPYIFILEDLENFTLQYSNTNNKKKCNKKRAIKQKIENSLEKAFMLSEERFYGQNLLYDKCSNISILLKKNTWLKDIWKNLWINTNSHIDGAIRRIEKTIDSNDLFETSWFKEEQKQRLLNKKEKTYQYDEEDDFDVDYYNLGGVNSSSSWKKTNNQYSPSTLALSEKQKINLLKNEKDIYQALIFSKKFKNSSLQQAYIKSFSDQLFGQESYNNRLIKANMMIDLGLSSSTWLRLKKYIQHQKPSINKALDTDSNYYKKLYKPLELARSPLHLMCQYGIDKHIKNIWNQKTGRQNIINCLTKDNFTLINFCKNIKLNTFIKMLEDSDSLKKWEDDNKNTIAHYMLVFSKEINSITKLNRLLKRFDYNKKNNEGVSLFDLSKSLANITRNEIKEESLKSLVFKKTITQHQKQNKIHKNSTKSKRKM